MRYLFLIALLLVGACQNPKPAKIITVSQPVAKKAISLANAKAVEISIDGMMCAVGCAATIEKNLTKTDGVVSAAVDFEAKTGWVVFDPNTALTKDKLIAVVQQSGDGKTYTVQALKDIDPSKVPAKN
jgi:mercuric ion binding protein